MAVRLVFSGLPRAQELDAVNTEDNQGTYKITDDITDPQERKSFLALLAKKDHRKKAELAEEFLKSYPKSAFVAQVYEIAAKSHIALGDFSRAIDYGKKSLRILPENPLLLVPLANAQLQEGRLSEAKAAAAEALEYLERFSRPTQIEKNRWPELRAQLKASSLFVLGRAAMMEGLELRPGPERDKLLGKAYGFLSQAFDLDFKNGQVSYLLGLVSLAQGRKEAAARHFAAASNTKGELRSEALERLQQLYESNERYQTISFESFVGRLAAHGRSGASTPRPEGGVPTPELSGYAGSEACGQCHLGQHEAWKQTGMGRMLRPYRPENVFGDFQENNEIYAGDIVRFRNGKAEFVPGPDRYLFARMSIEEGRHFIHIKGEGEDWRRYPVHYTIGSKWQQGYVTRLPNGQFHVFPFQYSRLHERWYNHWKFSDPPGSKRGDARLWENFTPLTSYQANCAACHTSQLRNVKGGGFHPDNVEFLEGGINCEMCHGPSARHVKARQEGRREVGDPLEPPVRFGEISSRDYMAICAQCHMQSAVRNPGPGGELNYSRRDGTFFERYRSYPLTEFTHKAFYKDGRFRITTFIVESLLRTNCFKKGEINCGHCHNPHPQDASLNPNSLKFRDQPDRMCLQCHSEFEEGIESHTRHPAASEASRCVSCHMPRILNALLFRARTHKVDDVPNAEMTLRFGPEESPNACQSCHPQEDGQWLERQLASRRESLPPR